jgi:hypothetical protein
MSFFTYDTSFIISYELSDLPDNFLLSSVVLLELIASAKDKSTLKQYERLRKAYEKDDTLIVPSSEDWLLASKILYWLEQGRKKERRRQEVNRILRKEERLKVWLLTR